jgi:ABC-type nitrate/sulfonate/bicarbonate transport system substrate-binding protein
MIINFVIALKSNQSILKKMSNVIKHSLLFVLCSTFLLGCGSKDNELTLADASVVWWMGPGTIAQKDSIYKKNGLTVKTFSMQTGLESKNAVVSGAADIGLVATTPLAMGAFQNEKFIVLCSYMVSDNLLSLLTPKTSDTVLFSKPTEPIAIVKGTISELYFYNYMDKHCKGVNINALNQLNVKPADVVSAVKGGSAKSAIIWEPFATMLFEQVPGLKISRDTCYTHRMYIITTPEVLAKKRSAIEKFVKSFGQACDLLNENPTKGKEILKSTFPNNESSMNALWNKVDFSLKFDYETMKELILKDAEITYKLEQTPKDKMGNCRQLQPSDIEHYFKHDFKLQ